MEGVTLAIMALAVYRITRLVTTDDFPPIKAARDWTLRRWPSEDAIFQDEEIEHAPGEEVAPGRILGYIRSTGLATVIGGPRGQWIAVHPHWFGDLITCPWCAGFWISIVAAVALYLWPGAVVWLALPFAFSAVAGLMSQLG